MSAKSRMRSTYMYRMTSYSFKRGTPSTDCVKLRIIGLDASVNLNWRRRQGALRWQVGPDKVVEDRAVLSLHHWVVKPLLGLSTQVQYVVVLVLRVPVPI